MFNTLIPLSCQLWPMSDRLRNAEWAVKPPASAVCLPKSSITLISATFNMLYRERRQNAATGGHFTVYAIESLQ